MQLKSKGVDMSNNSSITIDIKRIDPESVQKFGTVIQQEAKERLMEILKSDLSKKIEPNTSIYKNRLHNTIFINGKRGSGKTLFLLSIKKECKKVNDLKHNLYFFPPIDPTLLHTSENFLTIIIAQILNRIEEERVDEKHRDKFYKILNELSDALDGILKSSYQSRGSLENISKDQTSLKLEEYLHRFFRLITKILNKKRLILLIDDVDMAFDKGFDVLDIVRKYLSSPYIIPIITGDLELYQTIIENNFIKKIDKTLQEEYREKNRTISKDYLVKVLPGHRRIPLKNLYQLSKDYSINFVSDKYRYRIGASDESDNLEIKYFRDIIYESVKSKTATKKLIENLFSNPLRNIIQFIYGEYSQGNEDLSLGNKDKYEELEYMYNLEFTNGVFTNQTYLDEGKALLAKSNYDEAIKHLKESIKLDKNAEAFYYLGKGYIGAKNYKEAIKYFEQAIKYGFREESYLAIANIHIQNGDYSQALEYYKGIISYIEDIEDALSLYNIALSYVNLGDRKNAKKYYMDAIKYDREFYKPYIGIRELYFLDHINEKDIDDFIREFVFNHQNRAVFALYSMYDVLDTLIKDTSKYDNAFESWKDKYKEIKPIEWNFDALDKYCEDSIKNANKKSQMKETIKIFKEYTGNDKK